MDIEDLFAQSLQGGDDDHAPWEAVQALRVIGTRQVFEFAARWAESDQALQRARGVDVLAQLGKTAEQPSNKFPRESFDVVVRMLQNEREFEPLNAAISALGHLEDARAIPLVAAFQADSRAEIRFTVAGALGHFPNDPRSVKILVAMMEDADAKVRDWATFGVGVQGDVDSPEIRDALFRRLNDTAADVREEALSGLAKRQDLRSLTVLINELEQPTPGVRSLEAAAYMLFGTDAGPKAWSGADYVKALRERFKA